MNQVKIMFGMLLLLAAMALADGSASGGGGQGVLESTPTYKAYSGIGSYALGIGESIKTSDGHQIKITGMSSASESVGYAQVAIYDEFGNLEEKTQVTRGDSIIIKGGDIRLGIEKIISEASALKSYVTVNLEEASSAVVTAGGATGEGYTVSMPIAIKPTVIRPIDVGIVPAGRPIRVSVGPSDEMPPQPPGDDLPGGENAIVIKIYPGWNLVSFPKYWLTTSVCRGEICPAMVMAPTLKVIENTCNTNTLWHYEGSSYRKYEIGSFFNPSMFGYWLKSSNACRIVISGNNDIEWNGMQLQQGWNQIGAPTQSTSFERVKGNCDATSGPWKYNAPSRKYEKVNLLTPGEGYFVKV
ncbi:MAG: hypothetical protein ABH863_01745, partial [Candidatus Micrarchaeota archaeon]